MNIIAELNGKITTHLSTCMETALEDGMGLTGMVESTLAWCGRWAGTCWRR